MGDSEREKAAAAGRRKLEEFRNKKRAALGSVPPAPPAPAPPADPTGVPPPGPAAAQAIPVALASAPSPVTPEPAVEFDSSRPDAPLALRSFPVPTTIDAVDGEGAHSSGWAPVEEDAGWGGVDCGCSNAPEASASPAAEARPLEVAGDVAAALAKIALLEAELRASRDREKSAAADAVAGREMAEASEASADEAKLAAESLQMEKEMLLEVRGCERVLRLRRFKCKGASE